MKKIIEQINNERNRIKNEINNRKIEFQNRKEKMKKMNDIFEEHLEKSIAQLDNFCNGDESEIEIIKYKIKKDD